MSIRRGPPEIDEDEREEVHVTIVLADYAGSLEDIDFTVREPDALLA